MNTNEQTTLYYRKGGSDKIYQVSLEAQDEGFVVNFAYGRRGAAMSTGSKTPIPVDYEAAKKVYDRLIREKTAKGYTPGKDGTPYRQTEHEGKASGILCQLLHAIEKKEATDLLSDPLFCMQEKIDGRRLLIRKEGDTVEGINRRGLVIALPEPILQAVLETVEGDCILDGECLGDEYVVFDVLRSDGADVREHPYAYRFSLVQALVLSEEGPLRRIELVTERPAKEALFRMFKEERAEGVVFKRLSAPYREGRETHRDQFKYKFVVTASFVTGPMNRSKRSVALRLHRGRKLVSAGNVTIPINFPIPKPGTVIEVRYLYAFRESGAVYQPVYLRVRDDLEASVCTVDQLKYKQEVAENVPA